VERLTKVILKIISTQFEGKMFLVITITDQTKVELVKPHLQFRQKLLSIVIMLLRYDYGIN
jgi:hypothetical protein